MSFCANCGAESLDETANFCEHCGASLAAVDDNAMAIASAAPFASPPTAAGRRSIGYLILGGALGLVFNIVGVVCVLIARMCGWKTSNEKDALLGAWLGFATHAALGVIAFIIIVAVAVSSPGSSGSAAGVATNSSRLVSPATPTPTTYQRAIAGATKEARSTASQGPSPTAIRGGCGDNASVELLGPSQLGRTYHMGESLSLSFNYSTPACTQLRYVTFTGYFPKESPWYRYWCEPSPKVDLARDDWELDAACELGQLGYRAWWDGDGSLSAPRGTLTVEAPFGVNPAVGPSSVPLLDGFVLCNVAIEFDDNEYAGGKYHYEVGTGYPVISLDELPGIYFVGDPC